MFCLTLHFSARTVQPSGGYFGSPVLHAAASLGSKWACKKKRGAQNTCMLGHILEYAVLSIDTAMLMEAEINLCKSILRLG